MGVPGEQEYRTKGVAYCPHCDGPLFKGKKVAVIGGGNSGVEAAIDLAGVVEHVTLIEFMDQLKADAVLVKKLLSLPNVTVITQALTTEVHGDGQKVVALSYKDRTNDEVKRIELEGIFVQIGLLPNTDWLKGTVALWKALMRCPRSPRNVGGGSSSIVSCSSGALNLRKAVTFLLDVRRMLAPSVLNGCVPVMATAARLALRVRSVSDRFDSQVLAR